MRTVSPPWTVLVLVCGNQRSSGRTCCGLDRASSIRRALRDRARAAGLRDGVIVSRTGCLGVCSPDGTTVIVSGTDGGRTVMVLPPEDDLDALWTRVEAAARNVRRP